MNFISAGLRKSAAEEREQRQSQPDSDDSDDMDKGKREERPRESGPRKLQTVLGRGWGKFSLVCKIVKIVFTSLLLYLFLKVQWHDTLFVTLSLNKRFHLMLRKSLSVWWCLHHF